MMLPCNSATHEMHGQGSFLRTAKESNKQNADSIHNATASYQQKFGEASGQNAILHTGDPIGALMEVTGYEIESDQNTASTLLLDARGQDVSTALGIEHRVDL